jgi:hypothetical protein
MKRSGLTSKSTSAVLPIYAQSLRQPERMDLFILAEWPGSYIDLAFNLAMILKDSEKAFLFSIIPLNLSKSQ